MARYDTSKARPLGTGQQTPGGSVTDLELAARFKGYKRSIASRYRALTSEEIELYTPPGKLLVSPKIDGEMWFLVLEGGEAWLANPRGCVVYGDVPVLKEAATLGKRSKGLTILAGELFAVRPGGRPRHDDVAKAMGGERDAEVARLGFMAFDLLEGGDTETPASLDNYADRLAALRRVLEGGKRIQCVKTDEVEGHPQVRALYASLVDSGKAEGLVMRTEDGRTYKIKPAFTLDAVVIGYTERADEPGLLRSLALALIREDGQYQICGSCGNMDTETRRAMLARVQPLVVPSAFRHASNSGALYRFVRPELAIEVKVTDVLAEEADGAPIPRMVCTYAEGQGWSPVRPMPGVSILHPVFVRVREDKDADAVGVRMAQVLERVVVPELGVHAERLDLAPSTIVRREVYTKTTKGVMAVRKLLVWKSNKEQVDPAWPAFVVHFSDYSPGRKDPLQREVRLAPSFEAAEGIAEGMLTANIKKGWERVS